MVNNNFSSTQDQFDMGVNNDYTRNEYQRQMSHKKSQGKDSADSQFYIDSNTPMKEKFEKPIEKITSGLTQYQNAVQTESSIKENELFLLDERSRSFVAKE